MTKAGEIVGAGEDAIEKIKDAICEIKGLKVYEYIIKNLEEDVDEIEYIIAENGKEAYEEYEEELRERNNEYEEMVR